MLFTTADGRALRGPRYGVAGRIGEVDWPTRPIVIYDGIPIFIDIQGYLGTGRPESPREYLDYCIQEGKWSERKFHNQSRKSVTEAVDRFIEEYKLKSKDADFVLAQIE